MHEIGLRYKGNRCPFLLDVPRIGSPLDFLTNQTVVWVAKHHADWLIANNPRMFEVVGERGKPKGDELVERVEKAEPMQPEPKEEPEVETIIIPEKKILSKKLPGRPPGSKNKKKG